MSKFSYAYILDKYLPHIPYVMEDRTYAGIRFLTKDEPPTQELLDAFIKEEERLAGIKKNNLSKLDDYYKERQHQYRDEAAKKAIPLEEKLKAEYDSIIAEIETLRLDAMELQKTLEAKEKFQESWLEVSNAQEKANEAARSYLAETDWFVTRKQETGLDIPEDVQMKRAQARESITKGIEVFSNWQQLREKERPSREELKAAIKAGGLELQRIKSVCEEIHSRYKKPSK